MLIIFQLFLKKVDNFYNHIFTRIFRFLGGLSVLITLTKGFTYINLYLRSYPFISEILTFSIIILASIFIVYYLIINIIKINYSIYLLRKKPENFEVRNSPLNVFATYIAKVLYCVKLVASYRFNSCNSCRWSYIR